MIKYLKKFKTVSYKTSLVLLLNIFGFFLFFLRDILATRIFGLTSKLDAVYFLLLIPTTLTYFLFSPLYESQTPKYQQLLLEKKEIGAYFWKINYYVLFVFLIVCLVCFGIIKSSFIQSFNILTLHFLDRLNTDFLFALPMLLLGGWIISANIFLNSLGMIFFTTATSLVVPIASLVFILLGEKYFQEKSFLYGMLLGQIFNFVLIYAYAVVKFGKHFFYWRVIRPGIGLKSISRYFTQGSSYFCLYGMNALAASYAAGLHSGAVTMVLLVNKFVSFFSNLFQNAFNTVMYPYFSRIKMSDEDRFRKEKLLYLSGLTFIGFLGVFLIAILSGPISHILFLSSKVQKDQVDIISAMIKIGGIQLPMIMAMILLFKWLNLRKDLSIMFVFSLMLIAIQYLFMRNLDSNLGFKIVFLAPTFAYFLVGFLFIFRIKSIERFKLAELVPFFLIWIVGVVPLVIWGIR